MSDLASTENGSNKTRQSLSNLIDRYHRACDEIESSKTVHTVKIKNYNNDGVNGAPNKKRALSISRRPRPWPVTRLTNRSKRAFISCESFRLDTRFR